MRLFLSGVDVLVIAFWLGHEQVSATQIYVHADMTLKERAIARITPPIIKPGCYQARLLPSPVATKPPHRPGFPGGPVIMATTSGPQRT